LRWTCRRRRSVAGRWADRFAGPGASLRTGRVRVTQALRHTRTRPRHAPRRLRHAPRNRCHAPRRLRHAPRQRCHVPRRLRHTPRQRRHVPRRPRHAPRQRRHVPRRPRRRAWPGRRRRRRRGIAGHGGEIPRSAVRPRRDVGHLDGIARSGADLSVRAAGSSAARTQRKFGPEENTNFSKGNRPSAVPCRPASMRRRPCTAVLLDKQVADGRSPTADLRRPTSDGRPPMADLRQATSDRRPPTGDRCRPVADSGERAGTVPLDRERRRSAGRVGRPDRQAGSAGRIGRPGRQAGSAGRIGRADRQGGARRRPSPDPHSNAPGLCPGSLACPP